MRSERVRYLPALKARHAVVVACVLTIFLLLCSYQPSYAIGPKETESSSTEIQESESDDNIQTNSENVEANKDSDTAPENKENTSGSPEGTKISPDAENPDHVTGPQAVDGAIETDVLPETDFGISKRRVRRSLASLPNGISNADLPTAPGEVKISKTATPVEGLVNTWDITLRVIGKDTKKTSDIVLVLDRSGSMRNNSRMYEAKRAAKAFVNQLLPDPATRIAIVSFASDVKVNQPLTNDKTRLSDAIDNITSDGGTFTQAGIYQAEELLKSSNADLKNIVLLSDGEPTISYKISGLHYSDNENYFEYYGWNAYPNPSYHFDFRYEITSQVPRKYFDYSNYVGYGNQLRDLYGLSRSWYTVSYGGYTYDAHRVYDYNHGNSAIAEAGFAKDAGISLWTVSTEAGATGEDVLAQIASGSNYAYTADPTHLQSVFTEIAGAISSAVKDATVSDPMGAGFCIPIGSVGKISATQGEPIYDAATKTISWNVGSLATPVDSEHQDIKYAELTYQVEVDDDILDATPSTGDKYKTNGHTYLNYHDAAGNAQQKEFASPEVNPRLYVLDSQLYDKTGAQVSNSNQNFVVRVTGTSSDGQVHFDDYTVKPGQKTVLRNLRKGYTYRVEQIGYPDGMSSRDYVSSVEINGLASNAFDANRADEDYSIVVTNREIPEVNLALIIQGKSADLNKKVDFYVSVKRGDELKLDNKKVTLAHNDLQTVVTKDLALLPGDEVVITQDTPRDYTVKNKLDGGAQSAAKEIRFTVSGDATVQFINEKKEVPMTSVDGRDMGLLPLAVGLAGVGVGLMALAASKKLRG